MSWLHARHKLHERCVTGRELEPTTYTKYAVTELGHPDVSPSHQAACFRAVAPWGGSLTNTIGGVDGGALYRLGLAEAHFSSAVAN